MRRCYRGSWLGCLLMVGLSGACGGKVGVDKDRSVSASGGGSGGSMASSGGKHSSEGGGTTQKATGGGPQLATGGAEPDDNGVGGAGGEEPMATGGAGGAGGEEPQGTGGAIGDSAPVEGVICEPTPLPIDPQFPSAPPRDLFVCGTVTSVSFVREEGPARLVVLEPPDPNECGSLVQLALVFGRDLNGDGVMSENEVDERSARCTTLGPEGSIRLYTQPQVEQYANTVSFPADVTFYQLVADLAPLSALQEVVGTLAFNGTSLENLNGLDRLNTIDALWIGYNQQLTALGPLPELVELSSLTIAENVQLESLQGLESVQWVGTVAIAGAAVRDLQGLQGLEKIDERLTIASCPELTSLRALEGLVSVGSLTISGNPKLPSCEIEWLLERIEVENLEESFFDGNDDEGACP